MDSRPIDPSHDFYVVRTPWHSLIVHRVKNGVMIGDYQIAGGPFPDHQSATQALSNLLVTTEDAESNARVSPPHIAYPHYDQSKGPEVKTDGT